LYNPRNDTWALNTEDDQSAAQEARIDAEHGSSKLFYYAQCPLKRVAVINDDWQPGPGFKADISHSLSDLAATCTSTTDS